MQLIGLLLPIVFAADTLNLLQRENEQLRNANSILHKQLVQLAQVSDSSDLIEADFAYNKAKIQAILDGYWAESDEAVRLALAEEIENYLKSLVEDLNLMGGFSEGIQSADLEDLIVALSSYIESTKEALEHEEFNKAYSDLKLALDRKEETLRKLQLENAKLTGKLDSVQAELEQTSQQYEHDKIKLDDVKNELDEVRKDQEARLETLKQTMKSEEQVSRTKEINDFKIIQESNDNLIAQLQDQSAEQSLKIEQLSVDKSNLIAKLRLLNNTIDRMESELQARSAQLKAAEEKFEEFRKQVEYDTNDEIKSLRNSEQALKKEAKDLQEKQIELLESITNCTKELDHLQLLKRQKDNKIKELELELSEAENRIEHAKTARSQEIEGYKQDLESSEESLNDLQRQLDDALTKIAAQNSQIRELSDSLSESEYKNKRNSPPPIEEPKERKEPKESFYEAPQDSTYYSYSSTLRGFSLPIIN
ncbi:unnamed protein product [Blepharisma stoltei]|uniref:Uncharacterized protein n=1 Tax=Blepharisma stoltei TaxID=1481888 RepID=A0AAU9K6M2_9CILI|nr:unnamed protein product [Blepharisma stoltei]